MSLLTAFIVTKYIKNISYFGWNLLYVTKRRPRPNFKLF